MAKMHWRIGVASGIWLLSSLAHAATFGERLAQADQARSSDPAQFTALLVELERDRGTASVPEQQHLRLLINYRRSIDGDYGAAIGDAVALFDQAQEPALRYRAALLVANTAALTRDFTLGLRYLERALDMRESVADPITRSYGYGVAAVLYNQYAQFELGKHYADLWAQAAPDGRSRCFARHLQIEALHGMGRAIDDVSDIQAAISTCVAQGEPIASNLIRSILAQRWAKLDKKQQAIALLEASLPEVEATGYSRLIGEIRSLLAQYKHDQGDIDAAEAHASHVVAIKGRDPRWLPIVAAHHVLYQIALDRGDTRTALSQYRLYAEADKARLDDIKAREYAFQLSRHELAQKNQSIELLENQNQLLRLQQEVARKDKSNSQLLIALLVVLASSLGYWGWRGRRMHRTLRQLAQTDSLTGLANRRHFRAQSEALLAQARQRGRPMSLLLFDLDHFKQINDQCGHATGDWVLKEVARVGRVHCRPGDVFGRIGGEEFAVALVDCDLGDAEIIAERMREAIAAIDGRANGCPLPVSASVGCVATSVSGHEYETLVAHADAAMYRSKVGGRNRISRYQTASITPVPVRLESVPVAAPEAMRAS